MCIRDSLSAGTARVVPGGAPSFRRRILAAARTVDPLRGVYSFPNCRPASHSTPKPHQPPRTRSARLLLDNLSNKEIARKLFVCERTVKFLQPPQQIRSAVPGRPDRPVDASDEHLPPPAGISGRASPRGSIDAGIAMTFRTRCAESEKGQSG